jgi:hypothetical protein
MKEASHSQWYPQSLQKKTASYAADGKNKIGMDLVSLDSTWAINRRIMRRHDTSVSISRVHLTARALRKSTPRQV